jgi:hypothetical protein
MSSDEDLHDVAVLDGMVGADPLPFEIELTGHRSARRWSSQRGRVNPVGDALDGRFGIEIERL